ncbi:hypothetical protein ANANG_G00191140 [Anguilla anguilla]|uniref:CCDC92/74 N-terminal domain-containing protein n=1 Tax=Anguilla anguilla TaxID=7936 RepID=A0A9D3M2G5_ANGAN|nr:hypothetical protein ANANG_G00191140 [Anguilla anguilla]
MATASLENQLQSAQKNLLFLQQDHANTLKGLHAEIRRLQQHCTDLTYELTVRSSEDTDDGEARCRELRQKCEELEEQLKAKEEENAELLRELEQKNAMISVLENTIKEREKKYLEELKMKSHKLAVLSGELEQRASTIAYLTSQLHATKKRLLAGSSSETSPNVSPVSSYKPSPPPAKERQPQAQPDTPRRRMKKSLSQPLHSSARDGRRGPGAAGAAGRHPAHRLRAPAPPPPPARATAPPATETATATASTGPTWAWPTASTTWPRPAPPELETLAVDQVSADKVVRKRSGADRTV